MKRLMSYQDKLRLKMEADRKRALEVESKTQARADAMLARQMEMAKAAAKAEREEALSLFTTKHMENKKDTNTATAKRGDFFSAMAARIRNQA